MKEWVNEEPARILLVDDNYGNLVSLSAILEQDNVELLMAQTAEHGLSLLRETSIDIALLDVNMPGMNGLEMAHHMAEDEHLAEVPVLFVTGQDSDVNNVRKGYEAGAWDFICKPIDGPTLKRKVQSYLTHVRYRRALKQANAELQSARAYYQTVLQTTAEGIVVVDQDGNLEFINDAMCRLLRRSSAQLLGGNLFQFIDEEPGNMGELEQFRTAIQQGRTFQSHELRLKIREEHRIPIALSCNSLPPPRHGAVVSILDVSILKYMQSQLEKQAITDPLTGTLNRRGLMQAIDVALARAQRNDQRLALFYMDLDGFKRVNDSFGHEVGDELLKRVAQQLRLHIRPYDTLARLGGDEFVALMESVDNIEQIAKTAEKLLEIVSQPQVLKGVNVNVGVSIGIACYPECGNSVSAMVQSADMAMYQAKSEGKRQYRFFSPEMNGRARARLMLESNVRKAVSEKELRLYYQPQIYLKDGHLRGFEALMRWQQPQAGLIQPSLFIPILEETGLIHAIGPWLHESAAHQFLQWRNQHQEPLVMSINVSALQFSSTKLIDELQLILEQTGFSESWLEIEVTESALIDNVEFAQQQLQKLRDLGVRIAIDDFGTGYSSLAYLRELPVDTVKIDRSFTASMFDSNKDAIIVQTIIELGRRLQLEVIAEGVETEAQLHWLRELGCDIAQGYWFSRPQPPEEFPFPYGPFQLPAPPTSE